MLNMKTSTVSGVEFSIVDEERLAVDERFKGHTPDRKAELSEVLLEISGICNTFLKSVKHEPSECERIDKLWKIVDNSLRDYDFEKIETIRRDIGALILQHKEALQRKDIERLKNAEGDCNEL